MPVHLQLQTEVYQLLKYELHSYTHTLPLVSVDLSSGLYDGRCPKYLSVGVSVYFSDLFSCSDILCMYPIA